MESALIQCGMLSTGHENPDTRTAIIELHTIITMDVSLVLKNSARTCPNRMTDSKKGRRKREIIAMLVRIGKSQIR